jgi:hypothetical protein
MAVVDEEGAFRARVLAQGWDQGCLVDWRIDAYVTSATEAVGAGRLVSWEDHADGRLIVISQLCDLIAPREPYFFAVPLVSAHQLPGTNSSRFFVVNRARRLVAEQTQIAQIDKRLLPDTPAEQLISEARRAAFAAWCARRWRRHAYPDAFVQVVATSLGDALQEIGGDEERDATHSWRVDLAMSPAVVLFGIYDEEACATQRFQGYVDRVGRRTQELIAERLAEHGGPAFSATLEAVSVRELSVFDAGRFPPLTFEHLTYGGSEVDGPVGIESREEELD